MSCPTFINCEGLFTPGDPHQLIALFPLALLLGATLGLLVAARFVRHDDVRYRLDTTGQRLRGWWYIYLVVVSAWLLGTTAIVLLFALVSFLALREFVTMAPTARGDHGALALCFFVALPVQYLLVGMGRDEWFGIFVPVGCFLMLSLRAAIAGDIDRFLERTATVQWGLIACVYCVSYVPAMLTLDVAEPALLMMFMVIVVQFGDAIQNLIGTFLGYHRLPFAASSQASWEGMLGGFAAAGWAALVLAPATPFATLEAAGVGVGLAILGGSGRLVMGAVKRSRGVRTASGMIEGHGGVLDRVDSLLFAAPFCFYFVHGG